MTKRRRRAAASRAGCRARLGRGHLARAIRPLGYYFLIEALRDTPLFADALAEIDEIHIGVADGYRDYAAHAAGTDRN